MHTTKQQIVSNENFASKLMLPEIKIYLIYCGGSKIEYFVFRGESLLFHGNDYKPSPLHSIDGLESIIDLLGFICLKEGDTDSEYFKDYTAEQLEWCRSYECEALQGLVLDYEDKGSEYHQEAVTHFKNAFTY
ncbi:MAG: hypothetical protein QM763_04270 [Agriterribacter sp.]